MLFGKDKLVENIALEQGKASAAVMVNAMIAEMEKRISAIKLPEYDDSSIKDSVSSVKKELHSCLSEYAKLTMVDELVSQVNQRIGEAEGSFKTRLADVANQMKAFSQDGIKSDLAKLRTDFSNIKQVDVETPLKELQEQIRKEVKDSIDKIPKVENWSGGGGAHALSQLKKDTKITNVTDGQVLAYNAITKKWENKTPSGGGGGAVDSVFGRTGAVIAANGDYNTSQVTESGNLYYTATRFNTAFAAKSTSDLPQGTNLYFTDAAAKAAAVSNTAYAGSWDGVNDVAPSKNAVYDQIQRVAIETIGFTIGDKVNVIPTGKTTGFFTCPYAGAITAWNIVVDTGTATIKVWKIATGTACPTAANSINTSGVSISTGTAIHSTTLTDFTTTAVSANDIFAYSIEAASLVKELTFNLQITKS